MTANYDNRPMTMHEIQQVHAELEGVGRHNVDRRKPSTDPSRSDLASPHWCKAWAQVNGPDPLGYEVDEVPQDLTKVGS